MNIAQDPIAVSVLLLIAVLLGAISCWIFYARYVYNKNQELFQARKIARTRWIYFLSTCVDLSKKEALAREMFDHADLTGDELAAIFAYLPSPRSLFSGKDYSKKALRRHKKMHNYTFLHAVYFFLKRKNPFTRFTSISFRVFKKQPQKVTERV